jgi:hypothetical protein
MQRDVVAKAGRDHLQSNSTSKAGKGVCKAFKANVVAKAGGVHLHRSSSTSEARSTISMPNAAKT